ncbi:ATP-binding protein [Streptomyces sp. Li-HN-5-11]|uniref:ATP-binding protein n=1 Tax=Streptomyces sp. Li-HN-5-11 TaxID=3075432 RepID=UPI0028AE1FC3|nr:ATP-binding protein [Streptomyces sp. Li-HN-5-11]WNM32401.1 ATP-binding protein [Streptomyces sp. Li-HN-5-11]
MITPPRNEARGERVRTRPAAALRYGAIWVAGAARTVDARRAVRAFLTRAAHTAGTHVTTRAEQDAQLVTSELITNALRHAPGPCGLVLELSADSTRLTVTVRDTSRTLPLVRARDGARVGGHGLYLVRACSRALTATALPDGKQITAVLAL